MIGRKTGSGVVGLAIWMAVIVGESSTAAVRDVDFLAAERGLEPRIVDWFTRTLREQARAETSPPLENPASAAVEFWSVLTQPGGTGAAMAMLEAVRKRDPNVVLFPETAAQYLAWEREEAGKPREAIDILRVARAAYPRSPWLFSSLARAFEAAGEKAEAIRWAEKGLEVLDKEGGSRRSSAIRSGNT